MAKKKPCGVEPFDKEWGVGVSSIGEDFSPYPRVNDMYRWVRDTPYTVDHQRAKLVTEAYQLFEADTQIIKMAKVMKHIVSNVNIKIYPEELIVGEIAAPFRAAPIYPEFSYDWVADELENYPFHLREHDKYYLYGDNTKEELLKIAPYWKGRCIEDRLNAMLTPDEKKGSQVGSGIYLLNLYYKGGIGHIVIDYEKILSIGYKGLKKEVEEKMAALDHTKFDHIKKRDFYRAELITLEACEIYIRRYAELARKLAEVESDERRKNELLQIAERCDYVATEPPRTFLEALQLWFFATNFVYIESNGHSISTGRFDQYLNRFYEYDIENGISTKDDIQMYIELAMLKMSTVFKARDRMTIISNSGSTGFGGDSMTVGGVDKHGKDATNDLTYMTIDAYAHTRMKVPWLCVRLHANAPRELYMKTANVIRIGTGQPKIYNDEAAITAALSKGRSLEDARNYAVVGCVEISVPGREYGWHDAAYYNIARLLELAINDGKWLKDGSQIGPNTGYLKDFKSFEEVLEAYKTQLQYFTEQLVAGIESMEYMHRTYKPLPYLSMVVDGCLDKGMEINEGGAHYNATGPQAVGIGTLADGLSTIKQLVFDEQTVTAEELIQAVKDNWEGHTALYRLVNSEKVHHYGNDDDYADDLAVWGFNLYCDEILKYTNARGGRYAPGVYSVSGNVGLGRLQYASVEGRKDAEPVSDCIGAVHTYVASHDVKGPMAMLKSMAKLDHEKAANGTLLNWKFSPTAVSGVAGRDAFMNLLSEIVKNKVMHSQFNVISKETLLEAQKHPEKYKTLMVRVAGYSAYFVDLSRLLQNDIIGRTELSFD